MYNHAFITHKCLQVFVGNRGRNLTITFVINTGVHVKTSPQWILHLVLKADSVLTICKTVFVPDVTDYQLQGFSGRQLSWTQAWQKSEPVTQEQGSLPMWLIWLCTLTEFWICQYLFIYMLILSRYFIRGGLEADFSVQLHFRNVCLIFSTQLTAETTNLKHTYQSCILHVPLIQFPERWVLNSTNPFNNCFGHCALKVHLDFLVFFRRTIKLNQL